MADREHVLSIPRRAKIITNMIEDIVKLRAPCGVAIANLDNDTIHSYDEYDH